MIAKENQTLFDLAAQHYGDVKASYDLAFDNDLPIAGGVPIASLPTETTISTQIEPGQDLSEPASDFTDIDVKNFLSLRNKELATGTIDVPAPELGIGTMIIETSFEVF